MCTETRSSRSQRNQRNSALKNKIFLLFLFETLEIYEKIESKSMSNSYTYVCTNALIRDAVCFGTKYLSPIAQNQFSILFKFTKYITKNNYINK